MLTTDLMILSLSATKRVIDMAYVMSSAELCAKAEDLVYNHKTLYIMGCFGAPMIPKNKIRYTNNNKYNMTPDRRAMIENASEDTFGFDCVGMVKALCGDWCADTHRTYGGTEVYKVGNRLFYGHDKLVPDADAKGMLNYCVDVSRKWDEVVPGEFLWVSLSWARVKWCVSFTLKKL